MLKRTDILILKRGGEERRVDRDFVHHSMSVMLFPLFPNHVAGNYWHRCPRQRHDGQAGEGARCQSLSKLGAVAQTLWLSWVAG